jgi:hypothetical protein
MARETLVWVKPKGARKGRWVVKVRNGRYTATYLRLKETAIAVAHRGGPMVIRDLEPYRSPIDGTVITSRTGHRDHMRRHDVVELGNEPVRRKTPPPMPKAGPDIKAAIERLRAGTAQP